MRRLAPDCFLWADANCGYDVLTAMEVVPKLADVGVDATRRIIDNLTGRVSRKELIDADALYDALKEELATLP